MAGVKGFISVGQVPCFQVPVFRLLAPESFPSQFLFTFVCSCWKAKSIFLFHM